MSSMVQVVSISHLVWLSPDLPGKPAAKPWCSVKIRGLLGQGRLKMLKRDLRLVNWQAGSKHVLTCSHPQVAKIRQTGHLDSVCSWRNRCNHWTAVVVSKIAKWMLHDFVHSSCSYSHFHSSSRLCRRVSAKAPLQHNNGTASCLQASKRNWWNWVQLSHWGIGKNSAWAFRHWESDQCMERTSFWNWARYCQLLICLLSSTSNGCQGMPVSNAFAGSHDPWKAMTLDPTVVEGLPKAAARWRMCRSHFAGPVRLLQRGKSMTDFATEWLVLQDTNMYFKRVVLAFWGWSIVNELVSSLRSACSAMCYIGPWQGTLSSSDIRGLSYGRDSNRTTSDSTIKMMSHVGKRGNATHFPGAQTARQRDKKWQVSSSEVPKVLPAKQMMK